MVHQTGLTAGEGRGHMGVGYAAAAAEMACVYVEMFAEIPGTANALLTVAIWLRGEAAGLLRAATEDHCSSRGGHDNSTRLDARARHDDPSW